jgi:protein-disulfide isomerase
VRARALIPAGVLAVVLVGGGWVALRNGHADVASARTSARAKSQDSASDATLLAARTRGSPAAPVTVIEIADFQCPACRMFFTETLPALEHEYVDAGKVRMVFVNFPLVQLHKNAAAAAEFAMCAAEQHRFWPVHDLLYEQQDSWAPLDDPSPYFYTLADAAGLARDSLDACIHSGRARQLVMQEAQSVARAGVHSTPSFIIEGGLLPGAAPIEMWRPILDSIYKAKTDSR